MPGITEITREDMNSEESFNEVWAQIKALYEANPTHAVRSQELIKTLHHKIAVDLYKLLSRQQKEEVLKLSRRLQSLAPSRRKMLILPLLTPITDQLLQWA